MLANTPEQTVGNRMIKHVELSNKIESIASIIIHINQLKDRIKEGDTKSGLDKLKNGERGPNPCPSLSQVLNEGPDKINNMVAEAHKCLEELEQLLF
jgi:hypothetical protein